jgi:multidrug efflux system membrane fusion protein
MQSAAETVAATQPAVAAAAPRQGKLTFMDNAVNPGTGTVKVRATLSNPDRYFWPGQFVDVRLVLTRIKDAVLVPAEAQQIGQQGPYVYVVNEKGIAELRPIVPGQRQGSMLVVRHGVQPGDRVVTTGQMMVMPQTEVMVMPAGGMPPGMGGPGGPGGPPPGGAPAGPGGEQGKPKSDGGRQVSAEANH